MSETTTIKSLQAQGTWKNKDGETMYKFDAVLENGKAGEVNAKSANKWSVGDKVIVTRETESKWGTKLSLDRPRSMYGLDTELKQIDARHGVTDTDQKAAAEFKHRTDLKQDSIVTQFAIREAITFLTATTTKPDALTLYDVWGHAQHIKAMVQDFDMWGSRENKRVDELVKSVAPENCPPMPTDPPAENKDDLPF